MFKRIVSALVGTAAVGVGFVGNANAASFGEFQLVGGTLVNGAATSSTVTLNGPSATAPELDFSPEPTPIGIAANTGIFAAFNTASIEDIVDFGAPANVNGSFLDFGVSDVLNIPGTTTAANASLNDGVDTFELSEASYTLSQSGSNVSIDVSLLGTFIIGGQNYAGAGNLTFQTNNTDVAAVQTLLNGGGSLTDMTFSGALFSAGTPVPEPGSVLGLLVVGGAVVGGARRKKSAA